jgi:hypothetical protein
VKALRGVWNRLPDGLRRTVGLRPLRRSATTSWAIARHNARQKRAAPTLNFYPERPLPRAQLMGMLALIGVRIGTDPRAGGPVIAWRKGAWLRAADQAALPAYAINRSCSDISKSRVDELWASVAGYSVAVDPLVTSGPLVVKGEENAIHDWYLANGPLPRREPGKVYERLIDASAGELFIQSRPVIMRGHVPLVMAIHFPRQHWRAEAETFPAKVADFYTAAEMEQMLAFAAAIGLEYGELDVLRENGSGRLFVIDANPAPVRPHHIAPNEEALMQRKMADAFAEIFAADLAR